MSRGGVNLGNEGRCCEGGAYIGRRAVRKVNRARGSTRRRVAAGAERTRFWESRGVVAISDSATDLGRQRRGLRVEIARHDSSLRCARARGALAVLVSAMLDHCSISHKGTLFPLPSSSRALLTVVSVLQAVSSSGRAPSRLQHHIPQHPPPLQSTPWSAKPLSKAAAQTESTRKMAMRSSGHLSTTWSSFSSCVLHPKPDIHAS